eukprot:gene11201-biopygen4838
MSPGQHCADLPPGHNCQRCRRGFPRLSSNPPPICGSFVFSPPTARPPHPCPSPYVLAHGLLGRNLQTQIWSCDRGRQAHGANLVSVFRMVALPMTDWARPSTYPDGQGPLKFQRVSRVPSFTFPSA